MEIHHDMTLHISYTMQQCHFNFHYLTCLSHRQNMYSAYESSYVFFLFLLLNFALFISGYQHTSLPPPLPHDLFFPSLPHVPCSPYFQTFLLNSQSPSFLSPASPHPSLVVMVTPEGGRDKGSIKNARSQVDGYNNQSLGATIKRCKARNKETLNGQL